MTALLSPEQAVDQDSTRARTIAPCPRRFCGVFVTTLLLALAFVAALNLLVNPYAQYRTALLAPVVQTSRSAKLELLRQQTSAAALILGSSRVMKIEPDYLARRTGLTFFNAGVNYASPEDHLAWYRHFVRQTGAAPRMVVLGIDVASFAENQQPDGRLLSEQRLAGQITDVIRFRDRWTRWTDLVSWHQTKESIRSVKSHFQGALPPQVESYREDGLLIYHQREREIAEGSYDFEGPLEVTSREYEQRFRKFGKISAERLAVFEKIAAECERDGCALSVFLTPFHPRQRDYLASRTDYLKHLAELAAALRLRSTQFGFCFRDLSTIESFHGQPDEFIDGIHPLESNTRRMMDTLMATPELASEYAVQ